MSLPVRPLGAALAAAVIVAAVGFGWEWARFGRNDSAATLHLEAEVRREVGNRAAAVTSLAARVAAESALITRALPDASSSTRSTTRGSDDALAGLFSRLDALADDTRVVPATATVYVPGGPGFFHVLAWSDGPAIEVVAPDRLTGPPALFVARGQSDIRLVYVVPIDRNGARIAVVETETSLAHLDADGLATFATSYGPVRLVYLGAGAFGAAKGFVIGGPNGAPLLEVQVDRAAIPSARETFTRRVLAAAALPFAALLLWLVGALLDYRQTARRPSAWLARSVLAVVVTAAAALVMTAFARACAAPDPVIDALGASVAVAAAALVPGGLWWRRLGRRVPRAARALFVAESLVAGLVLLGSIFATRAWLTSRISAASLASWQSALFPFSAIAVVEIWSVLFVVIALTWTAAAALATVATRWRLNVSTRTAWAAYALWLGPTVIGLTVQAGRGSTPSTPALVLAVVVSTAALWSTWIRHYVRHSTQAVRLFFAFLALILPLVAAYPLVSAITERATRLVIEREYGPETAGQAERLRKELVRAEQAVDNIVGLPDKVKAAVSDPQEPIDSQMAFSVWRDTGLSETRVVSDIELYGHDRTLVSRFAFGFPEYVGRTAAQPWDGADCSWRVSGEVTRFGAAERAMLHATRGLCDATGAIVGAVVIHVSPNDYEALPFLASSIPYANVFETSAPAPRLPDLELVVYGWSLKPQFLSGRVAWSLDSTLAARMYRDGTPFWTTLESNGRVFDVYLQQNRAGIYALGVPRATAFDHAARLGEMAAVAAILFVLFQLGVALYATVASRRAAPLGVLLHEVRTSFYRKLFLFFILVAVGPVFLFAVVFGAYMTSKFRSDVEAEAAGVVTVARGVFEQVVNANDRPNSPAPPPTDDVMVWIRQVIGQDLNLYEGAELRATSQRDLFNSGLLPTRTPAIVYRRIALDRLPWFVSEDQQLLVAASPVSAAGRPAVLSVPLVSRQREIQEEFDELNRGVLVGSILVVLFSAGLGASLAGRVSDPVARLTKATRQIAAGRLDVRIAADTVDELRRLVDDFNTMTETLVAQRAELARTNQLKAWNEMARQVAHEIKNPLTPVQLAAEHLQRVHEDRGRPLGDPFDQCIRTILGQVRLLRQIASEFANFAGEQPSHPETLDLGAVVESIIGPYRLGLSGKVAVDVEIAPDLPAMRADRTLVVRALTNLVENAVQAMPMGGALRVTGAVENGGVTLRIADTGVGMDAVTRQRAFEPYFSTKTAGSGLGLANAKRNLEREGATIDLASEPGRGTTITIRWGSSGVRS